MGEPALGSIGFGHLGGQHLGGDELGVGADGGRTRKAADLGPQRGGEVVGVGRGAGEGTDPSRGGGRAE